MSFFLLVLTFIEFFICSILEESSLGGVDVLLFLLWTTSSLCFSPTFTHTFGTAPIKSMTKILFLRSIVLNSATLYLSYEKCVFSLRAAKFFCGAYAVGALVCVFIFMGMAEPTLHLILRLCSATFCVCGVFYLGNKTIRDRKRITKLRDTGVPISRECDFVANRASMKGQGNTRIFCSPSTFVFPPHTNSREEATVITTEGHDHVPVEHQKKQSPNEKSAADRGKGSGADRSGEAFRSTVGNQIFYANEAQLPEIKEDFVPPLTPTKVADGETMTFTVVRINRAVDGGIISKWCLIWGVVASMIAGGCSSLCGIGSSAIFLYQLNFDLPPYLFKTVLLAAEIPGSVLRVIVMLLSGLYNKKDFELGVLFVIAYAAGIALSECFGRKNVGVKTRLVCFCAMFACQAFFLSVPWPKLDMLVLLGCTALVVVVGYKESSQISKELKFHREVEQLRGERQRQAMDELCRDHSDKLKRIQGKKSKTPYWGGFDNDDDREYSKAPLSKIPNTSPTDEGDLPSQHEAHREISDGCTEIVVIPAAIPPELSWDETSSPNKN